MRSLPAMLVTVLFVLCSCVTRPPTLMHHAADSARDTRNRVWIKTPPSMSGAGGAKDGMLPITKTSFHGKVGWAIDYSLMFVARSTDNGKTWRIVDTKPWDCKMPWGLHVVSADCVWIWGLYTTETEWKDIPNSVIVTQDGGKTWHGLPHLVDWLYNVEVRSANHAVVIGRVRPENWPRPTGDSAPDHTKLPLIRFETKDGGKTFTKL